ncbi:hypothetical protein SAMN05421868_13446 [Paenibacillus naphthalenovorans]|nr:hypothetical protein SAMN05421868_13446 [Paenibacillus naphthalenovorans]
MRGTDIGKVGKLKRCQASRREDRKDTYKPYYSEQMWGRERIKAYLLEKYGTLNPDHKVKGGESA